MSFVSYAQNFEDVMLWRALKHVKKGFYIDVGANDPETDSVTKAFYERGWHGINIEPLKSHHYDLLVSRPRDINLQCAVGAEPGEIELWECEVRGWATAALNVVSQHTAGGHQGVFHKVTMLTLATICDKYAEDDIHFLKIDVEGFEKNVLDGMDFCRFRPWILLIEATKPNTDLENYGDWELSVLAAGYQLAYSDGLNRYYVAKERVDLLKEFRFPPNVFDDFIRVEQLHSELRAQRAENKAQKAEAKAEQLTLVANDFQIRLSMVLSSRSWQVTAPLRWISTQARHLHDQGLKIRVKAFLNKLIHTIDRQLQSHPILRLRLVGWSKKLGLYRLIQARRVRHPAPLGEGSLFDSSLEHMTPDAKELYAALRDAIATYHKSPR